MECLSKAKEHESAADPWDKRFAVGYKEDPDGEREERCEDDGGFGCCWYVEEEEALPGEREESGESDRG